MKQDNIKIIGVYIDRGATVSTNAANSLYCYSHCVTPQSHVECCGWTPTDLPNTLSCAITQKNASCHYFLEGTFEEADALRASIKELAREISNEAKGSPSQAQASAATASIQEQVSSETTASTAESATQQSEAQVATGTATSTAVDPQSAEEKASSETSQSNAVITASAAVATSDDITEDGIIKEGCKDPTWFWLLIFWLPLLAYLFYEPFKIRADAKKKKYRDILRAKRKARADEARRIREQAERERAEAEARAREEAAHNKNKNKKKKYKWEIESHDQYMRGAPSRSTLAERARPERAKERRQPKNDQDARWNRHTRITSRG